MKVFDLMRGQHSAMCDLASLLCACLKVDVHISGVSLKLGSTILGTNLSKFHISGAAVRGAYLIYCMAGNFRGVLIFVIFMVDLAVTKFPPTKINAYGDMVLCESMMMGVATNIVAVRPTLSSIASNSSHCRPADKCSTLIFFYLMPFVQVSIGMALQQ